MRKRLVCDYPAFVIYIYIERERLRERERENPQATATCLFIHSLSLTVDPGERQNRNRAQHILYLFDCIFFVSFYILLYLNIRYTVQLALEVVQKPLGLFFFYCHTHSIQSVVFYVEWCVCVLVFQVFTQPLYLLTLLLTKAFNQLWPEPGGRRWQQEHPKCGIHNTLSIGSCCICGIVRDLKYPKARKEHFPEVIAN